MPRTLIVAALLLCTAAAHAQTRTWNDDSCDIGVTPAATLLLPYFQVDFQSPAQSAVTTLFTVTNTSAYPQIMKITLWTDWAYPALTFNAYVTGYGVAPINLRDIFVTGRIGPGVDAHSLSGPLSSFANPNHLLGANVDCSGRLTTLPPLYLSDLRRIFTTGVTDGTIGQGCTTRIGGTHADAIGYATVDVVATCSNTLPTTPDYYATEILFDNVLIGDWMFVNPDVHTGNLAGGTPMVHIRAVPEGGAAGSSVGSNLPYTFYDRYTTVGRGYGRDVDRRQPLPSSFAARFVEGGLTGFATRFQIWRETYTGAGPTCTGINSNSGRQITEEIRFDDHENATTIFPLFVGIPPPLNLALPATLSIPSSASFFPPLSTSGDPSGWLYLNLSNGGSPSYSAKPGHGFDDCSPAPCLRQSQNWVNVLMQAEGRYAVLFDAAALGNGCSKAPANRATIGPAPNLTP